MLTRLKTNEYNLALKHKKTLKLLLWAYENGDTKQEVECTMEYKEAFERLLQGFGECWKGLGSTGHWGGWGNGQKYVVVCITESSSFY